MKAVYLESNFGSRYRDTLTTLTAATMAMYIDIHRTTNYKAKTSTTVYKIWSYSLGGLLRTTISIVWATFAEHLIFQNVIFPVHKAWSWIRLRVHLALQNVIFLIKMTPIHEVWSWCQGWQKIFSPQNDSLTDSLTNKLTSRQPKNDICTFLNTNTLF